MISLKELSLVNVQTIMSNHSTQLLNIFLVNDLFFVNFPAMKHPN